VLNIGTRIGPYEILAPLGAGGMGEVYRARDARLNREVALKLLPPLLAADPERLARFRREAQTLAALNHPHIAAIFGLEDADGQLALAMELVDGPPFQGPFPFDDAVPLALQICEALEYAHERGIVHRDLKPANLRLSSDGSLKLLDFGLAKALAADGASAAHLANSPTLTHMASLPGLILGTAAYMAPEQAKGKPVDRRADIWAFGCVLFEMLAGAPAFNGETVTDVLAAVVTAEPDWSRLPAATPPHIRALLQRTLKKDPRQRLQAIGDARILLQEPAAAALPSAPSRAPNPLARLAPWALVLALAALLAAAWLRRPVPASPPGLQFTLAPPADVLPGLSFALSPDGTQLVFEARSHGKQSLWLRRLDALSFAPIAGTEGGQFPFWSPDSHSIAFFAQGALRRVDLRTGNLQSLCPVATGGARGGSCAPDGTILFTPDVTQPIMRIPAAGGTPTRATSFSLVKDEGSDRWPFFLPDGRHFVYSIESSGQGAAHIAVGSLDSGASTLLMPLPADSDVQYAAGHLLYSLNGGLVAQPFDPARLAVTGPPRTVAPQINPEGTAGPTGYTPFSVASGLLAVRSSSAGFSQLIEVDRAGKLLRAIAPPGQYLGPALSPDGRMIAVAIPDAEVGTDSLWLVDASTGTRSRFTLDPGDHVGPAWSPDGQWIYYSANAGQGYKIMRKAANGAGSPELVQPSSDVQGVDNISRDGKFLLYDDTAKLTSTDVWALPLGVANPRPQPVARTPARENGGTFSPNGRWVAYETDANHGGDYEVFVTDFPAHASHWQISNAGGYWPQWSADGRELVYFSGATLMSVPVIVGPVPQFGPPRPLFDLHPPESLTESSASYSILPGSRGFLINQLDTDPSSAFTLTTSWLPR